MPNPDQKDPCQSSARLMKDALDWEASRTYQLEQSEQRAWKIALGATAVTFLSWLAIVFMMPLKETVPYLIKEDKSTGVVQILTVLKDKTITYEEARDKHWLYQYLQARETYDWYGLQKDYDKVILLSSPNVAAEYKKLFEGKDALDTIYGASTRANIEVISITPINGTATIRFSKKITKTSADQDPQITTWVATISYEYRNASKLSEQQRWLNPLGFQVVSYRIDPEVGGK